MPKTLKQFKLLVGYHVGPDFSKDPDEKTGKRPSKQYSPGDVVEDEADLVEKCGAGKFAFVGDKPGRVATSLPKQTKAPQGQVGSGFQVTTGGSNPGGVPPITPAGTDITAHTAQDAADMAAGKQPANSQDPEDDDEEDDDDASSSAADSDDEDLDSMTVAELKEYAEAHEIELHGAARKDDIVKAIRRSR